MHVTDSHMKICLTNISCLSISDVSLGLFMFIHVYVFPVFIFFSLSLSLSPPILRSLSFFLSDIWMKIKLNFDFVSFVHVIRKLFPTTMFQCLHIKQLVISNPLTRLISKLPCFMYRSVAVFYNTLVFIFTAC